MALHYQTEYRIGPRRVHRAYSGYQAFVAILFDLVFGLLFELVATFFSLAVRFVMFACNILFHVMRRTWKVAVAAMAALVFTLTLPFVILHRAIAQLAPAADFWRRDRSVGSPRKPEWAGSREV